jgi:hypothetical protein
MGFFRRSKSVEEITTEIAAFFEEVRHGKTTDMRDWKSDMDRKLEERCKAEEKREADRKAAEQRRLAEEKREAERRYVSEVKAHMRRYKCHICCEPSEGPTYVEAYRYQDFSDEIARNRYVDAHYEWDMPIGLRKCTICGKWCCEERHINKDVCERCFRKGYMPGDKRKWWDV